jgi:hypothetical protein
MRRRGVGAALAVAALGCAARPFPGDELAARFPELGAGGAERLAELTPYLWPHRGELIWFTCRFDPGLPVPVGVREGASAQEVAALDAALGALERSALGVRFARVPPHEAAIVVEFVDGDAPSAAGEGTANTVADCRLAPASLAARGPVLEAELAGASIVFGRGGVKDALGRARTLTPEERTGALLHELGHALGFQGHVRRRESVMGGGLEGRRNAGRAALEGRALDDPALAALYALPSGTVLARAPVSPARTQLVDRMQRVAEQESLAGPFARVGDEVARIFWRDAQGVEYGLQVGGLEGVLREAGDVVVLPESRTRRVLPRSRDVPLE